jgi:hypothetical protein
VSPQPIVIYGVPCELKSVPSNGGGALAYAVTGPAGLLTQQPTRFLAVAKAAEALRTNR